MRFDAYWDDDDDFGDETPRGPDLPLCPDGRHTGEIIKAEVKDLKFKVSEKNSQGTSIVLKIDIPKAQAVEAIIPCHFRGMIERVCRAASVAAPVKGEDWQVKSLLGRTVTIETVQGVGKTGREYVRIEKWFDGPEPLPAAVKSRAAPARSQTAKAAQAAQAFTEGDADAIPF